MNKRLIKTEVTKEIERPVDKIFTNLDLVFSRCSKIIYAIFLGLTFFGLMGLIWMIPFPQFEFLISLKMNTYLNWGSFFIAIVIYTYLRLAPTLSYAALFTISLMSFFIVQLEYLEQSGGATVVMVCGCILAVGLLGLLLLAKQEKKVRFKDFINLLGIGLIWLWSKVFKIIKLKY